MKKLIASLFASFMLIGLFSVASVSAQPGPETGNSEKGLCTAYFNGQKKGHDKQKEKNGEAPGPFAALEDRADPEGEAEGDEELASMVYNYCLDFGIGGNGNENGRWDCSTTDDEGNHECTRN